MPTYQVAYKASTKTATVQNKGDLKPSGSTLIGDFIHTHASDPLGTDENHVFYHHVRDKLYAQGELNMQIIRIDYDIDYVALVSMVIAPATVSIEVAATQQLTITPTPGNASNTTVTWTTSDATKATVSATGLVTGVAAGTATVTATSEDGAKTATRTITVTTP